MESSQFTHLDVRQSGSVLAHLFRVETLQKDDEARMVDIIKETLMTFEDEGEILASTVRRLPNFFSSYTQSGTCYLVLKDQAARSILGGVGIRSFAGLDPSENIGEIRELVISAPFRGLGLGKKLLELAIERASSLGYRRLYLEATSQMKHAQTLFHRSGFRAIASPTRTLSASFPSYFLFENYES